VALALTVPEFAVTWPKPPAPPTPPGAPAVLPSPPAPPAPPIAVPVTFAVPVAWIQACPALPVALLSGHLRAQRLIFLAVGAEQVGDPQLGSGRYARQTRIVTENNHPRLDQLIIAEPIGEQQVTDSPD